MGVDILGKRQTAGQHPSTLIGRWLHAAARGQSAERNALHEQIGQADGWRRAQVEFMRAVSELAVRRLFGTVLDLDGLRRLVFDVRRAFPDEKSPSSADMELLARTALGDSSAATDDLALGTVFMAGVLIFSYIAVHELELTNEQLDRLIVAGETLTIERGWRPI